MLIIYNGSKDKPYFHLNQQRLGFDLARIEVIEKVKDNEILMGLAELLQNEKEKAWVKDNLRTVLK